MSEMPASAEALIQAVIARVQAIVARREAQGETVSEEQQDQLADEFIGLALACGDVPADALRYFAVEALTPVVQEAIDAGVLDGELVPLPDGRYQRVRP